MIGRITMHLDFIHRNPSETGQLTSVINIHNLKTFCMLYYRRNNKRAGNYVCM